MYKFVATLQGFTEPILGLIPFHSLPILGQFYAHTHRDDFHLQILDAAEAEAEKASTKSFVLQTPSVSPVYSNNPAFKVFSLRTDLQALVDYDQYYLDLVVATGKPVLYVELMFVHVCY